MEATRWIKIQKDIQSYAKQHQVHWGSKADNFWMRLLGHIMFFTPDFMTRFTTTMGSGVYFPIAKWVLEEPQRWVRIMGHELVHIFDYRKNGWWAHGAGYLQPQLTGALGFLGFLGVFGFIFPPMFFAFFMFAFLIFLAPWKSKRRRAIEMRGYALSMASVKWMYGSALEANAAFVREHFAYIVENFTGSSYWYMDRDEESVVEELVVWLGRINDETIDDYIPIAKDLRSILSGKGIPSDTVKF